MVGYFFIEYQYFYKISKLLHIIVYLKVYSQKYINIVTTNINIIYVKKMFSFV
ncbi:hypothetical protein SDC9_173917 [bioreactor metagenome]|uniref:Uncharacterized protein n=1 Tax=bioreactor metagenome TaxID=1076179 RepID=A0A645GKU5_9ZZZZ